ncbi:MAG: CarD family transcriptional regulator [Oscillospiraceae bacterium]|nr:CarD family transcriptional regulator [Oscillospiraceae bacterium]
MYSAGDKVIYAGSGVCEVVEVCTPNFSRSERGRQYYRLRPFYSTETIYIPVDTSLFMRPIITAEEAKALIARIPELECAPCTGASITSLRQQYEQFFLRYDCLDYIRLLKGVEEKCRSGKKLGQTDLRYRKRAEEMLCGELAAALGLSPGEAAEEIAACLTSK